MYQYLRSQAYDTTNNESKLRIITQETGSKCLFVDCPMQNVLLILNNALSSENWTIALDGNCGEECSHR